MKIEPRNARFEVTLADGRVVLLSAVDVAYFVSDAYALANLPTSNLSAGQLARVTDRANELRMWDGSAWVPILKLTNTGDLTFMAAAGPASLAVGASDQVLTVASGLPAWGHKTGTVSLTNQSGGQVVAGDVVILDPANASSFTTSTTQAYEGMVGVALETIASGASGRVAFAGVQTVAVTGAVAVGRYLQHSMSAKLAEDSGIATPAAPAKGAFGIALTAAAGPGAGTVTALCFGQAIESILAARLRRFEGSAQNAVLVTLDAGPVPIASVDLGSVIAGDRILVSVQASWTKGGTAGLSVIQVDKSAGTATVVFVNSEGQLRWQRANQPVGEFQEVVLMGVAKVTASGTLTLELQGKSLGSNSTVTAGFGQIYAWVFPGT